MPQNNPKTARIEKVMGWWKNDVPCRKDGRSWLPVSLLRGKGMIWAFLGIVVLGSGFIRLGQLSVWVKVWTAVFKVTGLIAAFMLLRYLWRRATRPS